TGTDIRLSNFVDSSIDTPKSLLDHSYDEDFLIHFNLYDLIHHLPKRDLDLSSCYIKTDLFRCFSIKTQKFAIPPD
ncbi:hypothetical protein A2U01_0095355, partial [Trifolium medium]|nr:hypothetical protein [Trifolium medium]